MSVHSRSNAVPVAMGVCFLLTALLGGPLRQSAAAERMVPAAHNASRISTAPTTVRFDPNVPWAYGPVAGRQSQAAPPVVLIANQRTRYPVVRTTCPVKRTFCPASLTSCPQKPTFCPRDRTKCPREVTKCYQEPTVCGKKRTMCPPVATL
ncbi:MAG: hypothetical protein KAI25_14025, partial [Hyphomicrobiaceae bacterium]|nr:hypothetical protein [Hyphomicrobiaceae bacterium]